MEIVQDEYESWEQAGVEEDYDGGDDEAGRIGLDSSLADGFPGKIENEHVENPRDDGEKGRGDLAGTENEGEESRVTEESEENMDGGNDQSVGEGGASGTAGESVQKDKVRSDGGQAPRHETELVEREWRLGRAESSVPSDQAERNFGSDFGRDGGSQSLNGGGAGGREMSSDIWDGAGLGSGDVWRGDMGRGWFWWRGAGQEWVGRDESLSISIFIFVAANKAARHGGDADHAAGHEEGVDDDRGVENRRTRGIVVFATSGVGERAKAEANEKHKQRTNDDEDSYADDGEGAEGVGGETIHENFR